MAGILDFLYGAGEDAQNIAGQESFDFTNNMAYFDERDAAARAAQEKEARTTYDPNAPKIVQHPDHIQAALDFITQPGIEGFTKKPISDPSGSNLKQMAIGFGTTVDPRTGAPVNKKTPPISVEDAKIGAAKELYRLDALLQDKIFADITPLQRAAILSKMYNVGPRFLESDAIEAVNKGDFESAAATIEQYKYGRNKRGELVELPGLVNRAKKEAEMMRQGPKSLREQVEEMLNKPVTPTIPGVKRPGQGGSRG